MVGTGGSEGRVDAQDLQDTLSQIRLHELLTELGEHIGKITEAREQFDGLLRAMLVISASLDLDDTLHSIVESAKRLSGAEYGALGIRGENDEITSFIFDGIDDEAAARIGPLPTGGGVLGLLIEEPKAIRLSDLSAHPSSIGFPPNHPPMSSFLGVPIRIRGEVYGNLYLTEKSGGREFTDDDEAVVQAFASAAGTAIENARLYDDARTRQSWIEATRDIATELLGGTAPDDVLQTVADKALMLTAGDLAFIAVPNDPDAQPEDVTELIVHVASGKRSAHPDVVIGTVLPVHGSTSGASFRTREPIRTSRLQFNATASLPEDYGPALISPLRAPDRVTGVLVVLRRDAADAFTDMQLDLVATFGDQAALTVQIANSSRRLREFDVLADRDRIARELHDHVIQRIFAAGLSLQGTAQRTTSTDVRNRLASTIDELQETVQDIRSAIFDLQSEDMGGSALRRQFNEIIDEMVDDSGLRTTVRVSGPLSVVDTPLAGHALAVLREGISNCVRHAHAKTVVVTISVGDDLTIEITDDGCGLPEVVSPSGLKNLRARAKECGGDMKIGSAGDTSGTTLTWSAPLP
ncbi:GAF domain-containing sensor histidine kinase [Rhodococcoides yunnanense]|uniref:GAF domain-containing sensor histidine kinase n=1 Tax=Rhodococcoides yunnanense TaxID=278209 RepID=UPI00093299E4|nr:GAF domain-containing protein [Rhodococcus yunnanensis]